MSRDFIGSKIAIITKSQCRYVGTIIGIDAQTSSIVLGSAKCYGTENRTGYVANGHKPGAVLPIVQFANSDIEDLKIVDEESTPETPKQSSQSIPTGASQQASIHDDPAIVSAVVGATNKVNTSNSSLSNRLIHNLQHMNLSDEQSGKSPKNEGSHLHPNSDEIGTTWSSLLSSSEWERNNSSKLSSHQQAENKSKFFDDFMSNNKTNQSQFHRSHQRSSNTHSTQTSRENGNHYNGRYDNNGLPDRQPFFSNDRQYPQRQQNRYQNGQQQQQQQRHYYNNRRPQMSNQPRRNGGTGGVGGGNRETFQTNSNDYDEDFDFETSNQKFNKLTNDDEVTQQPESTIKPPVETDHSILYDKKRSFFDNLVINEPSDSPTSRMYNRSKNTDTFGTDAYQRSNHRFNGNGYRRSNNNYRQNNNGYQYRY